MSDYVFYDMMYGCTVTSIQQSCHLWHPCYKHPAWHFTCLQFDTHLAWEWAWINFENSLGILCCTRNGVQSIHLLSNSHWFSGSIQTDFIFCSDTGVYLKNSIPFFITNWVMIALKIAWSLWYNSIVGQILGVCYCVSESGRIFNIPSFLFVLKFYSYLVDKWLCILMLHTSLMNVGMALG